MTTAKLSNDQLILLNDTRHTIDSLRRSARRVVFAAAKLEWCIPQSHRIKASLDTGIIRRKRTNETYEV